MVKKEEHLLPYFIVSITISTLGFYYYSTKNDVIETEDLEVVFKKYKTYNQTKGQNFHIIETISKDYYIPQVHHSSFNQKEFIKNILKNDTILITKEKDSKNILQIKKNKTLYFDETKYIKDLETNFNFSLILACLFTLFCGILIFKMIKS